MSGIMASVRRFQSLPVAIFATALLIVLGGMIVILQNEATYGRAQKAQAEGLTEVLAASVTAALDFGDTVAAQEAVDAFQVNRQIEWIVVYDRTGTAVASFARAGVTSPQDRASVREASANRVQIIRPVIQSGQRVGSVALQMDREATARRVTRYLLLGGLLLLAALVVAGLGVTQAQLRSANQDLSARAEALAQANVLLEDQMAQRAHAEEQLRQSQKMQALGQLTGGIAHDFNNLLTVIQGSADILMRETVEDARRIRFAKAIVQAATSASALTSQLLAFARRQPLRPVRIDINDLVRSLRDLLDRTLGERITIKTLLCAEGCPVEADLAQMQSAILNIASNARDAMPEGGILTIGTENVSAPEGQQIHLTLKDSGSGMDEETRARVFEPFFTTKAAGKGTGLGLSQVYGFATQSGGDVRISSAAGSGTSITMILPCTSAPTTSTKAPTPTASKLRPVRILVVEDNEQVGAFAEALLADQGHRVSRVSSAEDALALIGERSFDLVFSDVVMPGMGGLRLAEILAVERPELPLILATGYSEEITKRGPSGRPFILKPYRLTTLLEAIASALPEFADA
ncbi:ATP-binding protein [Sphingomonas kaistensis]|uniref:histidine kinase n=1 Tax=Sphingomonas kaistensis TaxID=298708 RepID=A0ABZ2FZ85_9SPHN